MSIARFLGFNAAPADQDGAPDEFPTVPPAPYAPLYVDTGPSDAYTAGMVAMRSTGAGQSAFRGAGASPVATGSRMYRPQYTPLAQVAFPVYDAAHRTWQNLFHPLPPTADAVPRPDWNPFASLQNFPMKAYAGLRVTVFGGPRTTSVKGNGV